MVRQIRARGPLERKKLRSDAGSLAGHYRRDDRLSSKGMMMDIIGNCLVPHQVLSAAAGRREPCGCIRSVYMRSQLGIGSSLAAMHTGCPECTPSCLLTRRSSTVRQSLTIRCSFHVARNYRKHGASEIALPGTALLRSTVLISSRCAPRVLPRIFSRHSSYVCKYDVHQIETLVNVDQDQHNLRGHVMTENEELITVFSDVDPAR